MGNVPAWQLLLTMTDQLGTPPAHADEGSAIPLAHAGEGVGTVSVRDAAKSIGVSERTIRRRIQDGILSAWKQETEHAPWFPRGREYSVVFRDKLWIYGGKTGVDYEHADDIWYMAGGIRTGSGSDWIRGFPQTRTVKATWAFPLS